MSEFYTHLDVLDRLRSDEANRSAPPDLVRAHPLPSRLTLAVKRHANIEGVKNWLETIFGPRFLRDQMSIPLEAPDGASLRLLPIVIEHLDEESEGPSRVRLRPTLTAGSAVAYNVIYDIGEIDSLEDCPPVLTFHSFKGGMGRTTLALSLAAALTEAGRKVLFIDADFEAPGVSTLLKHVMPNPRIAFADLLALAHASTDTDANDALRLASTRLRDQQVGQMLIMPCTRDLDLPAVSPDTLTLSSKRSAFFVGTLVAKLGRDVGADLTIVDLRAGLSELVASLFLDQRLQHALVTTLNGQAIDGTIMLLERMRNMSASWYRASGTRLSPTLPTVIVNQVPSEANRELGAEAALSAMNMLEEELRQFLTPSIGVASQEVASENPFQDASFTTMMINADPSVAILPRDLREVQRVLMRSNLPSRMLAAFEAAIPLPLSPQHVGGRKEERRQLLADYARRSIFAESRPQQDIFPTSSLVNLAGRHQATLPTVAVVGEKGSGKTYTFMSLALAKTWGSFSHRLGVGQRSGTRTSEAVILPVTSPQDLDTDARAAERGVTAEAARLLSGNEPLNDQKIADAVQRQLHSSEADSVVSWRDFWLDLIAWRSGFSPETKGAFKELTEKMPSGLSVVAAFDGIETLFSHLRTSREEQTAIEALLRLVPDWLTQLPVRTIGCVIFIREDLARYALISNFKQFEDRYSAYSLRWDWAEASALALWMAQQAGSLPRSTRPEELVLLDEEARSRALADLWGWKMGPSASREARSLEWTMSSLSDFNRRIKARDLVRFLAEAASRSRADDAYYDERLLSPRAMRDAVVPCSKERVLETGEENVDLERIFGTIRGLTGDKRELPWSFEHAHSVLGSEGLRIAEENGVLFRYGDDFFVPELYRSGLNLSYSGGARRKVVTLMRQAAVRAA